ncbi:MAG: DUF6061 family protein [Oscillospiraceae bacterium]|nr:DUF6061 family protein [Oscillospiraceae bacterium]
MKRLISCAYHDPVNCADLILKGDIEDCLKQFTDYCPLDERE